MLIAKKKKLTDRMYSNKNFKKNCYFRMFFISYPELSTRIITAFCRYIRLVGICVLMLHIKITIVIMIADVVNMVKNTLLIIYVMA